MNKHALCWINQRIIPASEARISVYDHGLLYGDGVFEGLRFYNGKVFMLDAHLQRLQQSTRAISLALPLSLKQIEQAIEALLNAYQGTTGYLRLVVTRGIGPLGIDPQKCLHPKLFIIADDLTVVDTTDFNTGIKLLIASTRSIPADCLDPKIKSLNYLNKILARIEANAAGMDEALMLNVHGFISEGSADNIFIIKNRILKTPKISDGLLPGITRDVILEIASDLDISNEETSLTKHDLIQADECFLTGTGAELIPVSQINHHKLQQADQPIFPSIALAFRKAVFEHCSQFEVSLL